MKRKIVAIVLILTLMPGLWGPATANAAQIPDVTGYSYTITPIASPFTYYLYVETDNPDPFSFRLVDRDSAFFGPEDSGSIRIATGYGHSYTETDPGTYYQYQCLYPDVVYENPEIFRVKGGYIFTAHDAFSDGGEFVLLQKTKSGSSILHDQFVATDVTIPCQSLTTREHYLIDTCTTEEMSFFEKLDAVQQRLDAIAVYPRGVYDSGSPNEVYPYPLLAASPYPELGLNDHYNMYDRLQAGLLSMEVYPFVLDSAGVPGTMKAVARMLEPECQVTAGSTHAWIDVTLGSETHTYGGSGSGGYAPLYTNRVEPVFTFESRDNLGLDNSVEGLRDHLLAYRIPADADAQVYRDLIAGETFCKTIAATGGTWIRCASEGFLGYGISFAYVIPMGSGTRILTNAWVDGRYVGVHEVIQLHETFEDHPTADIVVSDVTYTDRYGTVHTQDVCYRYDAQLDLWAAPQFYAPNSWNYPIDQLPPELILTREQVEALDPDRNSSHLMESGLVYDGTEYPGTPFTQKIVTGVEVPETLELYLGQDHVITARVLPEDALDTRVTWSSSDPAVVAVRDSSSGSVYAAGLGSAVLTAVTSDGAYTASCTVTVIPEPDPCEKGHDFGSYTRDGNATCETDGTKTAHCSRCEETHTVSDPGSALGHNYLRYTFDNNATCQKDGTKTAHCTRCGKAHTVTIPGSALDHNFLDYTSDANATCEKDGTLTGVCQWCDKTDTIPYPGTALGHNYPGYTTDNNATCEKDGTKTAQCARCGKAHTLTVPGSALGHTYSDDRDETCDRCGQLREITIETTPMYRLYNPNSGEHFYTGSLEERDVLTAAGWAYEGVAWNAPTKTGTSVYRLYNPNSGDHHYTMSAEERDMLVGYGWQYEGICWNSASPENLPLYRLYNPNAHCGSHHYTGSIEERDTLVGYGWIYEGIGWFGMLN